MHGVHHGANDFDSLTLAPIHKYLTAIHKSRRSAKRLTYKKYLICEVCGHEMDRTSAYKVCWSSPT
jgi:RNA polymerase-binding transcription factor DksA